MAWQLIYTSAPRLLEAGRSGFGTVARHREIGALLVSAIERVSQFSRLPRNDEHRIIYSHRHIAVGGSRFHLLSCIRDSGADYTGRTNHLAHHVVVEPRELARLGSAGPSPADVLLAMAWCDRWDEAPHWFGAGEEFTLDSIARRIELPARCWTLLAGDARRAALLVTPEAIRGCYVICPATREQDPAQTATVRLFGESLLLAPERLWDVTFTTHVQPSDEAGDFHWRGLPSGSPLRASAEQSGRPVFDLGAMLPLPEGPAAELAAHGRRAVPAPGPAARPRMALSREAPVSAPASAPRLPGSVAVPATRSVRERRQPVMVWVLAGVAALAVLAALGFLAGAWLDRAREAAPLPAAAPPPRPDSDPVPVVRTDRTVGSVPSPRPPTTPPPKPQPAAATPPVPAPAVTDRAVAGLPVCAIFTTPPPWPLELDLPEPDGPRKVRLSHDLRLPIDPARTQTLVQNATKFYVALSQPPVIEISSGSPRRIERTALTPPYALIVPVAGRAECHVVVLDPNAPPTVPLLTAQRGRERLVIAEQHLRLEGLPVQLGAPEHLVLEVPPGFFPGDSRAAQEIEFGGLAADVAGYVQAAKRAAEALQAERDKAKATAAAPPADPRSLGEQLLEGIVLSKEAKQRLAPPHEPGELAGVLRAIGTEIGSDAVFSKGNDLTGKPAPDKLKATRDELFRMTRPSKTEEGSDAERRKLKARRDMIARLLQNWDRVFRAGVPAAHAADPKTDLAAIETRLGALTRHPLLAGKVPSGRYRVFFTSSSHRIPLLDLDVP